MDEICRIPAIDLVLQMKEENELAPVQHRSSVWTIRGQKLGFVVRHLLFSATASLSAVLLLADASLLVSQLVRYCVSLIFYCSRQSALASAWKENVKEISASLTRPPRVIVKNR